MSRLEADDPRPRIAVRMRQDMIDEVDEVAANRSAFVREAVEKALTEVRGEMDEDGPESHRLRRAYRTLRATASGRWVSRSAALSVLSQKHGLTTEEVSANLLRPLVREGWVRQVTDGNLQTTKLRIQTPEEVGDG